MSKMTVARCMPADLDRMKRFFEEIEEKIDTVVDECELAQWIINNYDDGCGRHWQRLLFGYETLVDNACDPSLTYLDWNPKIKAKLTE